MRTVPKWLTQAETDDVAGVFARNGYDGTRWRRSPIAAGVPRATLYYHFKGKDEVAAWLLRSTLAALGEAVGGSGRQAGKRQTAAGAGDSGPAAGDGRAAGGVPDAHR